MSAKGDHSWVLDAMQRELAKKTDYARATGAASAFFTVLGIMMRNPSDDPARDLEEIRKATQDAAKRFCEFSGDEYREWDYVPHRLRVIREG